MKNSILPAFVLLGACSTAPAPKSREQIRLEMVTLFTERVAACIKEHTRPEFSPENKYGIDQVCRANVLSTMALDEIKANPEALK